MAWQHDDLGYEPGDVRCNGDVLVKSPPPNYPNAWCREGIIFVTLTQMQRAKSFGWYITSDSKPELGGLVKIRRQA